MLFYRWVNYQGLLEACLVGKLVDDPSPPVFVAKPSLAPPGDSLHNQYNTTNNMKASPNSVSYKQKLSRMFIGMCSGKIDVFLLFLFRTSFVFLLSYSIYFSVASNPFQAPTSQHGLLPNRMETHHQYLH